MGYNLSVACLTHEVQCYALRGEEALVIRRFGALHPGSRGCVRDVSIDNGYAEKGWSDGPNAFRDVYDEVMTRATPSAPRERS